MVSSPTRPGRLQSVQQSSVLVSSILPIMGQLGRLVVVASWEYPRMVGAGGLYNTLPTNLRQEQKLPKLKTRLKKKVEENINI